VLHGLTCMGEDLRADRDIGMLALRVSDGGSLDQLRCLSDVLLADPEIAKLAIQLHGVEALSYFSENLRASKDFGISAVHLCGGYAMEYLSQGLRQDRDVSLLVHCVAVLQRAFQRGWSWDLFEDFDELAAPTRRQECLGDLDWEAVLWQELYELVVPCNFWSRHGVRDADALGEAYQHSGVGPATGKRQPRPRALRAPCRGQSSVAVLLWQQLFPQVLALLGGASNKEDRGREIERSRRRRRARVEEKPARTKSRSCRARRSRGGRYRVDNLQMPLSGLERCSVRQALARC